MLLTWVVLHPTARLDPDPRGVAVALLALAAGSVLMTVTSGGESE